MIDAKLLAMVPEAAGTAPHGIFILADDYLNGAKLLRDASGRRPARPARLLAYHSIELFLKTYMRSAGETIIALRNQNHDIVAMLDRAVSLGLILPRGTRLRARKMVGQNDYVLTRYVTEDRKDIPLESVIAFAETIRACVIAGLEWDEYGAPRGRHWLGEVPPDYTGFVRSVETVAPAAKVRSSSGAP